MPLTVENTSALVGGTAPTMQAPNKRWVKVLRTFVGCKAAVGDVIEMDARTARELIAANKLAPAEAPKAAVVAEIPPPANQEPAAPRRGRTPSKES